MSMARSFYLAVVDEGDGSESLPPRSSSSFRYTRSLLQCTLQFMGCKPRHAFKISSKVFDVLRGEHLKERVSRILLADTMEDPLEEYKTKTTIAVRREKFLDVVCEALSLYKYVGPNQRGDLVLACRIRERKESVTILLCGTSGCGKSTLSTLLGSRLGITTIISTDSIRHMMRSFVDEKQNPLLWASTYHAGEFLDPVAVAAAKGRKTEKRLAFLNLNGKEMQRRTSIHPSVEGRDESPKCSQIGKKQLTVEGYKAQSEMVIDSLDRLISTWEDRQESVIVEGVHLSLNFVMGLMQKHPTIIPFMIYISNEDKHMERFAVRAKYMTLDPEKNKYVKYFRNIRTIQEYLCGRADKYQVPKINNTNVDRSVAAIHATVFGSLRRRNSGEQFYEQITNTVSVVSEEYKKQCGANSLSSRSMFRLIQRLGSSRQLMAVINTDGSVAKAWPIESAANVGASMPVNGDNKFVGNPIYGPFHIEMANPVNLQFGHLGISAWPTDTVGTSQGARFDDSKDDLGEKVNHGSSSCSSPKVSDGSSKELMEKFASSGGEETDSSSFKESDDDELSDLEGQESEDEMEGSVDERSAKSDEYDDWMMLDGSQDNYFTENDNDRLNLRLSPFDFHTNSSGGPSAKNEKSQLHGPDRFVKNRKLRKSRTISSTRSHRNAGKVTERSLSFNQRSWDRVAPSLGKSSSLLRHGSTHQLSSEIL